MLEAMGISKFLGNGVIQELQKIFADVNVTPSLAHQNLVNYNNILAEFIVRVDRMIGDLAVLKITQIRIEQGKFELGVSIPRTAFDPTIVGLHQTLKTIEYITSTFNEIATGNAELIQVKNISSSDWQFYIECAGQLLIRFAGAVERILGLLNKYADLRKKKNELEKDIPAEHLAGLKAHLESFITAEVKKFASELIEQHAVNLDGDRKQELTKKAEYAMVDLAKMLDEGAVFEVSAGDPEPLRPEGDGSTSDQAALQNYEAMKALTAAVRSSGQRIREIQVRETKILMLPDREDQR